MPALLPDLARFLRDPARPAGVWPAPRATDAEDGAPLLAPPAPQLSSAEWIEPGPRTGRPVGGPDPDVPAGTGFTHFLDGIQRSVLACSAGLSPVVYAHVAAVVRERQHRRLRTWREASGEGLYAPVSLLAPEVRDRLAGAIAPSPLIDTLPDGEDPAARAHPGILLDDARKKVNEARAALERQLAAAWVATHRDDPAAWLLVDGSLTDSHDLSACPRAVGVIKSHATQYFGASDQEAILALGRGERSAVFAPSARRRVGVYSWYLRLRDPAGHEPLFGLVRLEMAPAVAVAEADRVSRWLLAETAPLSLPDARWDRLIYPIRDCEQVLRSRAPSMVALEAALR